MGDIVAPTLDAGPIGHVGGAAEPSVAVTPVSGGGGGGLFSSTGGVVLAAIAGISLALNLALLLILLLKR